MGIKPFDGASWHGKFSEQEGHEHANTGAFIDQWAAKGKLFSSSLLTAKSVYVRAGTSSG
ncbi:hypothetical protein GCM10007874_22060 [Labrys miyagiensis]|uniref:Uncharacterized protein n=1 Tax=Labrys miyagiensis TaxID=346912 RepID=A0ABQ6CHD4_9HYPH|nr:hypothetical protein GCM10007874_22060 [Labrys miyagiensis]